MSGSSWRFLTVALVAVVLAAPSASADEVLEQIKRKQQVEAQQVVADVKGMLGQAKQLAVTDARAARDLLLKAQEMIADARGLDDTTRSDWRRQIQVRLQDVQAQIREQDAAARIAADKQAALDRQKEKERQDKMKSGVTQAEDFIKQGNKVIALHNDLRKKREQGTVAATNEIYYSASQMEEKRITERFIASAKRAEAKLTKEEKELLKMLNSTLSVDFNKTAFKDVLDYLQEKTDYKLKIIVDELSLKDAGVEYDSPVTFKQKKLVVRTILRKILADRGLTYIVKDGAVHVMTPEKARSIMITRTYPVQDLLGVFDMRWGPYVARAQMMQNAQQLINLIVNGIEPNSWKINNPEAGGTIVFHEPSMSLIIRNSAEFHSMMPGSISW